MRNHPKRAGALALVLWLAVGTASAQGDARRGEYIAKAAGCVGCHTENSERAVPFAGGRAIKTPFGTFYGPNITPHPEAGLGSWREEDFLRALRFGVRPDGSHYFPAFPYTSFTRMADADARDLWAYLRTLAPSDRRNRSHDLSLVAAWRAPMVIWKWLFFTPALPTSVAGRSAVIERGAYLVDALGHCGECHTPRNALGASRTDRYLAGAKDAQGKKVPNLTPTRVKKWNDAELKEFLQTGITPDFDSADEVMAEVVRNTTSRLTPEDLAALVAYLRSVAPQPEQP